MNKPIEHYINSRVFFTNEAIDKELDFNQDKNYLFNLPHLQVIDVRGDKALDFLQGQLTCDVNQVSDIQIVQGVQCNLKGRILSLMDIIQWNGIKLVLPKDLLEPSINSLTKTAQLSRVSLHENNQFIIFGLYVQNSKDILPESAFLPIEPRAQAYFQNYCCYHLGNGFYIFLVNKDAENHFCKPFVDNNQLLGSLTWHSLQLKNKQFSIYPESRALFLPHRLGLHETHFISFNKGCYKGQEIIARTHYKATLKHELTLFTIETAESIFSGQKLLNNDTEYGEIVDYSILGKNNYLVVASVIKGSDPKSNWITSSIP